MWPFYAKSFIVAAWESFFWPPFVLLFPISNGFEQQTLKHCWCTSNQLVYVNMHAQESIAQESIDNLDWRLQTKAYWAVED